jgi:hypothetical protein
MTEISKMPFRTCFFRECKGSKEMKEISKVVHQQFPTRIERKNIIAFSLPQNKLSRKLIQIQNPKIEHSVTVNSPTRYVLTIDRREHFSFGFFFLGFSSYDELFSVN